MKKTLLVSAVAMAMSGSAMAAEMYGNIRLELQTSENDLGELGVDSSKLVLGSKGSSDLGNGLTASYQLEMEHDNADYKSGGTQAVSGSGETGWANDKSWVALGGDFGKVTIGRKGDLSSYACGATDILLFGAAEGCSLGHNDEFNDAIMYTGSAGAIAFGYVFTADGTAADDDSAFGASFSGDNFSVGFQIYNNEAANTSPSQIGGHYSMGDMTFGITLGDSDGVGDTGGTDLSFQMPLGGGDFAIVLSSLDAPNSDSTDLLWHASLGGGAYYGIEWNSDDADLEDVTSLYLGMNF